jgi:hypothetical protein
MKKTLRKKSASRTENGNRREYRFDYRTARPNRFAGKLQGGVVAVVLDRDVASVFRSSDSVNALLRSVIAAMPERTRRRTKIG